MVTYEEWIEQVEEDSWVLLSEDIHELAGEEDLTEMYIAGYSPRQAIETAYEMYYEDDEEDE